MAVAVNIHVESDVSPFDGIADVVVGVFDPTTFSEVALARTDANGLAGFVLEPGVYEVRLQKLKIRFAQPYKIAVTLDGPNGFTARGTVLSESAPLDPNLCRCSGRLVGLTTVAIEGAAVQLLSKVEPGLQVPKVFSGSLVAGQEFLKHTDADGFISFDLPRGGVFNVMYAGEDDQIWPITVPDRPTANLIDLMFPCPQSLAWDQEMAPGNAISVAVGETKQVLWSMAYSDFQTKSVGAGWLEFENSDSTVACITFGEGFVMVRGLAAGSLTLTGSAVTPTPAPSRIPAPAILVPPLSVNVTP